MDLKRNNNLKILFDDTLEESNEKRQEIILNQAMMKINEKKGPVLVLFTSKKEMENFKKKVSETEVPDRETQNQFMLVWKYHLRYLPKEIAEMISSYITRKISDTELIVEARTGFVHTNFKINTLFVSSNMLIDPYHLFANDFKMRKDLYKKLEYEIKEL